MSEEMSTQPSEVAPALGLQDVGETPKAPAVVHEEQAINTSGEHEAPMDTRQWANKFDSPEEMEKSYLELQKKLHAGQPKTGDMELDALLNHVGLEGGDLASQWMDEGKLTPTQYEAFKSRLGLSEHVINSFMKSQMDGARVHEYVQKEARATAEQMAGGAEELDNLFAWTRKQHENNQAKLDAIDKRLADPKQYQSQIKELLYDYKVQAQGGFTQPLVQGQAMPNVASGFTSVDEYLGAMKKAREEGFSRSFLNRLKNTPAHIKQGMD